MLDASHRGSGTPRSTVGWITDFAERASFKTSFRNKRADQKIEEKTDRQHGLWSQLSEQSSVQEEPTIRKLTEKIGAELEEKSEF